MYRNGLFTFNEKTITCFISFYKVEINNVHQKTLKYKRQIL